MIFCREVPVRSVLDAAYREQHISKWNYEITEVQEIHIPDQNYKDGPLKLLFPFLKYIFGTGIEVLQFNFVIL